MRYTKHMMERMVQRGFDKDMIDMLITVGSYDLSTNRIILDKDSVNFLNEMLVDLTEEKKIIKQKISRLN